MRILSLIILLVAILSSLVLLCAPARAERLLVDIYSGGIHFEETEPKDFTIPFELTLKIPGEAERSATAFVEDDGSEIDTVWELDSLPLDWFANPGVEYGNFFTYDFAGESELLVDILRGDPGDFFDGDWFEPIGGIGLMGYDITRVEATILEAFRRFDGDVEAVWVVSIYGEGVPGDYNGNGKVDTADYVVWRKLSAQGLADQESYALWRKNFGRGTSASSAVPEPRISWLAAIAIPFMFVVYLNRVWRKQ